MRVMSAGDGYRYLLRTVVAGDGVRSLATPLTRYYEAKGTPPGRWMGAGLSGLADGTIKAGDEVIEEQLQLLLGHGRDPLTGEPLGRAYPHYAQGNSPHRRAVAGYDFTFSVPKSASILWGVSDAQTQEAIVRAHHGAVAQVVAFMEREVAATRAGVAAGDDAVAQVDVTGLIATAFDHFDSRAGDPHLHTHFVVSNKVQAVLDGRWRSLDGRPLHGSVVALSELHEALFADALTRALGVEWEQRARGRDRNLAWSIRAMPETLVAEFSTRARRIDGATDELIAQYVETHGRRPTLATIMKLRAQATLATRPAKQVHSLADLTAEWRARATRILGTDATEWATRATHATGASARASNPTPVHAADLTPTDVEKLARRIVATVAEKRSTWRHWNLAAEAARQTMHLRFATPDDRLTAITQVVAAAEHASLRITPPDLGITPAAFRRDDGSSVFRPKHSTVYTSEKLLAAEERLQTRAADASGPTLPTALLRSLADKGLRRGGTLTKEQHAALAAIGSSGRVVDLLVGPAGAGKTTVMAALRQTWEAIHDRGSVIGLAPSAAAAHVLAADLGIRTENLAKWWQNHLARGTRFARGQLVIIDEASLAGTLALDRVTSLAARAGAKVLLVGDWAQLQSVDAGGAFAMLAHARADTPELTDVHRFTHDWEKTASLALRHGHETSIDAYLAHDRVREGDSEQMADAAYRAWRDDSRVGRVSVLISGSNDGVAALNERARTDAILDGRVDPARQVGLHDGARASVGDTIITRRNDRTLHAGRGWVRNGDRWTVTAIRPDGSIEARRAGARRGAGVVLPAEYVAEHVELGYAVTAHRAQGITTDTAHVVVARGTTRENLYVAMTRGRAANTAYVALDTPDVAHAGLRPRDSADANARSVLAGVLAHVGAERSAHETITAEQDSWGSIAQLAAEYETIAAAAQRDRWTQLMRGSGLTTEQADAIIGSGAFGPLCAELRRAEAYHVDVEALLHRLVVARGFEDAADIAAVVTARLARVRARVAVEGRPSREPRLIAGLIPRAVGPMDAASRAALDERARLIERRAEAVLDRSVASAEPWTRELRASSRGATGAGWRHSARTIAAYRDRYGVTSSKAVSVEPGASASQLLDAETARGALEAMRQLLGPAYFAIRAIRSEAQWPQRQL